MTIYYSSLTPYGSGLLFTDAGPPWTSLLCVPDLDQPNSVLQRVHPDASVGIAKIEEDDDLNTWFNAGFWLGSVGRHEEALRCYARALGIDPHCPEANFNLACSLLMTGRFQQGWEKYECRFSLPNIKRFMGLLPNLPPWDGGNGKLLLFSEQGVGDIIFAMRFIPSVKANVTLACPPSLVRLVERSLPDIEVITFDANNGTPLAGDWDCGCSVMSLPRFAAAADDPYLRVPEAPRRLEGDLLNVGVVWAGSPENTNEHHRSCYRREFNALVMPGVRLVSLQKGGGERVWANRGRVDLTEGAAPPSLVDFTDELGDFYDTAQAIRELDLLVTVDTAVAHLGGALGKPVWLLLGPFHDFRWLAGETTPWYPSVRIFRQPGGDWKGVFEKVRSELKLQSPKRSTSSSNSPSVNSNPFSAR